MKASAFYTTIDTFFTEGESLKHIERVPEKFSDDKADSVMFENLKNKGLSICYYFEDMVDADNSRKGTLTGKAAFHIACVQNPTQQKEYIAANSTLPIEQLSALQLAEEIVSAIVKSKMFRQCGIQEVVEFQKNFIRRMAAKDGLVQYDIGLLLKVQY